MQETLQIHVAVGSRAELAYRCLCQLRDVLPPNGELHVWIEPGISSVLRLVPGVAHWLPPRANGPLIDTGRIRQLKWWRARPTGWLYFTDADAVHAPGWFDAILAAREASGGLLASGYRTAAHDGDLVSDHGTWIEHRYLAGISALMDAEQAETVCQALDADPDRFWRHGRSWDWEICDILGGSVAVTPRAVVDHIGYGGIHHPEKPGDDGDRGMDPVPGLAELRDSIASECGYIPPKR